MKAIRTYTVDFFSLHEAILKAEAVDDVKWEIVDFGSPNQFLLGVGRTDPSINWFIPLPPNQYRIDGLPERRCSITWRLGNIIENLSLSLES